MQRMRELGAIGIDMRPHLVAGDRARQGSIAVLCNGAGVTMATFDLVTHLGGLVCGAVELHGALAAGMEHTASVVEGLRLLSPDVLMINGFYQLRPCDTFAEAISEAVRRPPAWIDPAHVVVRMRGLKSREAIEILERAGCRASTSLAEACAIAVEVSRRTPQANTA
jgi:succinyl-CoA synthetase beta subunit